MIVVKTKQTHLQVSNPNSLQLHDIIARKTEKHSRMMKCWLGSRCDKKTEKLSSSQSRQIAVWWLLMQRFPGWFPCAVQLALIKNELFMDLRELKFAFLDFKLAQSAFVSRVFNILIWSDSDRRWTAERLLIQSKANQLLLNWKCQMSTAPLSRHFKAIWRRNFVSDFFGFKSSKADSEEFSARVFFSAQTSSGFYDKPAACDISPRPTHASILWSGENYLFLRVFSL